MSSLLSGSRSSGGGRVAIGVNRRHLDELLDARVPLTSAATSSVEVVPPSSANELAVAVLRTNPVAGRFGATFVFAPGAPACTLPAVGRSDPAATAAPLAVPS